MPPLRVGGGGALGGVAGRCGICAPPFPPELGGGGDIPLSSYIKLFPSDWGLSAERAVELMALHSREPAGLHSSHLREPDDPPCAPSPCCYLRSYDYPSRSRNSTK